MFQSAPHSGQPNSSSPLEDAVAREDASLMGPPTQPSAFLEAYQRVADQASALPTEPQPQGRRRWVDTEGTRALYAAPTPPPTVNAGTEGNALRVLLVHGKDPDDIIAYWAAGAGIPFAVQAIAAAAYSDFLEPAEFTACARRLHCHLLAADLQTQAEVHQTVGSWRAGCNAEQSAVLSSIFLDPAWIDADLRAMAVGSSRTMISAAALTCATDMEALAACLGSGRIRIYDVEKGETLGLTLLARHGDAAEAPLLAWMAAAAQAGCWTTVGRLFGAFDAIGRVQQVFAPLVHAMRNGGGKVVQRCRTILLANADAAQAWLAEQPGLWHRLLRAQVLFEQQGKGGSAEAWGAAVPEPLLGVSAAKQGGGPLAALMQDAGLLREVPCWVGLSPVEPLPPHALPACCALLAAQDTARPQEVRSLCDPRALAGLVHELFELWVASGHAPKHRWVLSAMGAWGDDSTARLLAARVRAWPGEGGHQRAVYGLDALAQLGSDLALMLLNGIATTVKFKALRQRAQEKMAEVAARRGFTAEEMADRLVPTLGLGADGSLELNYGPRAFRVGFDEQLAPYVLDAAGARRRELPKPGKQDDAELAQASLTRWKDMKKDARAMAKLQIARLELALSTERRWRPKDFHTLLVQHPLLMNLVQRWVWGAFTPGSDEVRAFRVAEDGTYADAEDALVERAAVAGCEIGLLHPLRLDAASQQQWSQRMLDYGILQPFPQLSRRAYALEAGEGQAHLLERFTNTPAQSGELRALLKRGWHFSMPADGGLIESIIKPIAADLLAELHLSGDLNILYWDGVSPTQTIERVELRRPQGDERLRVCDLSPVIVSEVIADVTRTLAEQGVSGVSDVSDVSGVSDVS